jgi:hypothetical protein
MRTGKTLSILLFTATLAFYGCKKSNPAPKVSNFMTFTLQGNKYTVNVKFLVTVSSPDLTISGDNPGGPGLTILINNYQQRTSFSLDTQAYVDPEINSVGNSYFCDKGRLVISSLTQTHVTGTFTGTASQIGKNTGTPISGTFDADIPQQ